MKRASPDIEQQVKGRMGEGVSFVACGNTMKAQGLAISDLPVGFDVAVEGGVTRIADLQSEGYLYLRP
jgi:intracellular sulfur oxidation DsrE/DsrF family protein